MNMSSPEGLRIRRAEAKERGYCSTCMARPAKPGRLTCQPCIDDKARYKQAWIAAGRCTLCCGRKRNPTQTSKRCSRRLAASTRERRALRKQEGRCVQDGCGWSAAVGKTMCPIHLEEMRVRALKRNRAANPQVRPRHCATCGQRGHNRRSCGRARPIVEYVPSVLACTRCRAADCATGRGVCEACLKEGAP